MRLEAIPKIEYIKYLAASIASRLPRWFFICSYGIMLNFSTLILLYWLQIPLRELITSFYPSVQYAEDSLSNETEKEIKAIEKKINTYQLKLSKPGTGNYLVVNTVENYFYLYQKGNLIREGKCSTGSYVLLDADAQKWLFKTPQGRYSIQGKTKNPVWRKPDWAFIEEGLPVPPINSHLRYEAGVLGDYALSIGNGYLIHGTLYQRLLGMPVTHGCVRLADEDLKTVFNTLSIGQKVYIF